MLCLEYGTPEIHVAGWGFQPGPLSYSNEEVCRCLGLPVEIGSLVEERIGTRHRFTCVDLARRRQIVAASDLAHAASLEALRTAGVSPHAVEAIVAVGTIQDHYCPSVSVRLQKLLGLERGLTFDLSGGCGVWAQGLLVAGQLLAARMAGTVLVVAAEPLSRLLWTARRAWEPLAFGDAAAAMLLSTVVPGPFQLRRLVLDTVAQLDGVRDEIMVLPILGDVLPAVLARHDRFDEVLPPFPYPREYRSIHRAGLAARWGAHYLPQAIRAVTDGLPSDLMFLCPHQPSRIVLDAVQETLGLSPGRVARINPDFGNLSSASSPAAFCVALAHGPARHRYTVLAPVGTGLTYGAALLERTGKLLHSAARPGDLAPGPAVAGTSPG